MQPITQIAVYPWIRLDAPIAVAGVEMLPRSVAVERAGALGANVSAGTSYFRDHYLDGAPQFGYDPLTLRELEPSVVLLDAVTTIDRIETANLIWFMSVLFANDLQFKYANATTFAHFYQRLGGDPGLHARSTRRMHGRKLGGAMVMNVIDVRPQWCGEYHSPDEDMLSLLEQVIDKPNAGHIKRCIQALLLATTDDDTQPEDAEHANYARAVERLLHRHGHNSKTRNAKQRALGAKLLSAVYPGHTGTWQILEVRDAMRDQRNAFWHPENRKNATRPFEKQTAVRPNLLAFHATTALLIASAREVLGTELPEKLETYVQAVEEWIGTIQENDARPSREASNFRAIWSSVKLRVGVARHIREYQLATQV